MTDAQVEDIAVAAVLLGLMALAGFLAWLTQR